MVVRPAGVPDGALGVHADAVAALAELGPHAPVRQAAVGGDVERRELPANDSATISVELSGVTTMPFGNAIPSATWRTEPSGVTSAMMPGANSPPPMKSKQMLLT